jgi:hypothetical protein
MPLSSFGEPIQRGCYGSIGERCPAWHDPARPVTAARPNRRVVRRTAADLGGVCDSLEFRDWSLNA